MTAGGGLPVRREELDRVLRSLEERPGYGLPAESEVRRLELAAADLMDMELVWRCRLLLAELAGRRGELEEAITVMHLVSDFAAAHGNARLLARSHLILAWTYRDVGDLTGCLEHAIQAVELLDDAAPANVRSLHLIRLADALDECGSPQEARLRYEQAEALAVREGNTARVVTCLNNRAYGEYLGGDHKQAETTISRLVDFCRVHETPVRHNTLDTMARIQIALGRPGEALSTMDRAFEAYQAQDVLETMTPAEFLLTVVLAQRQMGDLDAAQRSLDECRAVATSFGLSSVLARLSEEQAELHALRGNFEAAFRELQVFHAADKELISEQRAAQARLRQAVLETNEVRAEADRLHCLDAYRTQMIATIAHELKNPLTALIGHLDMLSCLSDPWRNGVESLAAMERSTNRLWVLADSLLELTRLERGDEPTRRDAVDLDEVAAGAMDLMGAAATLEGVHLEYTSTPGLVTVLGDAEELHRALLNLISNAVKYSDRGETVTVLVQRVADEVVFSCADNGLGISQSDQERLFTEFFRSTNQQALARPGIGLGLAIVQRVAERHRGHVEVTSKLGTGSTLTLHLPAAPADG